MAQWIIVIVIILLTVAWIIWKLVRNKDEGSPCCGCALAENCAKKDTAKKSVGKKCENRK